MDSLDIPELIDLENMNLHEIDKSIKIIDEKKHNNIYTNEHENDIHDLIIRSNILNHILLIHELSNNEDKTVQYQMYNTLKNLLILHGKYIHNSKIFIVDIEKHINLLELSYNRYVIHKMLNNIKKGNYKDNIHFREINIAVNNIPPISAEERIAIEEKLPQFNYSRQIKKNQKPFNVGEIVGAKDKENKWWLARVLHRHDAPDCADYWYYIRFENCGSMHDEWISSKTFRVRYYNPKKHFLKRRRDI